MSVVYFVSPCSAVSRLRRKAVVDDIDAASTQILLAPCVGPSRDAGNEIGN